ncbi:MAG: chemotaxis protein CheW [Polyangiales bacterium]
MSEERRARRGRGRGAERQLVLFRVAGVTYGLSIEHVREVVNPLPIIALPHAPAAIVGVCDHRGDVVPVIDLRARFALPALTEADALRRVKWILFDAGSAAPPSLASGGDSRPSSLVPARGGPRSSPHLGDPLPELGLIAIVVDEVRDVLPVHEALRPPPPLGSGEDSRGIQGVVSSAEADRGIVFVLDVERLRALTEPIARAIVTG